jgi:hypothetical protein
MTNKNLIKFAILKNQPLELTLFEQNEETNKIQNYLTKNMIFSKNMIMKKEQSDEYTTFKKTNRTTYLTKNLQKLKYEIKNRKENEREKQNSIKWHIGMQYNTRKSSAKYDNQQIYSVRESSNPFRRKKNDAFDLQHIKKKIDTCNRNIEENRIKNNLKKLMEANNLKSVYAKNIDEDALGILTNQSNYLLENLNSNITTHFNTNTGPFFSEDSSEKNSTKSILKDSVDILKIIKRKNNKVKFNKNNANFPSKTNQRFAQQNNTTEFIKIRNYYDSSAEKKKISPNKKSEINEDLSENFKKKFAMNFKNHEINRKNENQAKSDTYRYIDDAEDNLKTFRHKTELKTEEEFTRDFAKDFKRVINRLEKEKNSKIKSDLGYMSNGMFNTKVIMDVFEGRREIEIDKM